MNMDYIISICGWTAFAIIAALLSVFTLALAWGAIRLGFHISTRLIRKGKHGSKSLKSSTARNRSKFAENDPRR